MGGGGDPGTGGGISGDGSGGYVPPAPDPIASKVVIDSSVKPEDVDEAKAAEKKLEDRMKDLDSKIKALPNDAKVRVGDKTLTGTELKSLWLSLKFVIVGNDDFGANSAGANHNGTVYIYLGDPSNASAPGGLLGYQMSGERGGNFLLAHELAHASSPGKASDLANFTAFQIRTQSSSYEVYKDGSPEFIKNEVFENDLARAIGNTLNEPVLTSPTFGYSS